MRLLDCQFFYTERTQHHVLGKVHAVTDTHDTGEPVDVELVTRPLSEL